MTDRELLELAAKAAGYRFVRLDEGRLVADIESKYPGFTEEWNPLTDDDDALRLAVDLELDVDSDCDGEAVIVAGGFGFISLEYGDDDKHAATRRAIVLAAAEIGREK